jgi:hypothetical protein
MSKWTTTRRDPGRTYIDENKVRVARENREMIWKFIEEGIEAEPKYVAALKIWFPAITPTEIIVKIMRFRDAVMEKQRDGGKVL